MSRGGGSRLQFTGQQIKQVPVGKRLGGSGSNSRLVQPAAQQIRKLAENMKIMYGPFFSSSAVVSVVYGCPRAVLVPLWCRDAWRLDTPGLGQ